MVALASILVLDTAVLILDEPTTGQDHRTIKRISRILGVLRENGKTVIAICHDNDFCEDDLDRLIALRHSRVVLDEPMAAAVSQTDILASTYVEPPQISRLASALDFDSSVLSVEDFVRNFTAHRQVNDLP